MPQQSLKRRFFRSPLKSCGHGKITPRKIGKGTKLITIKGEKLNVTKGNRRAGKIYWYRRSDTKRIALRNFLRDRSMRATRRSMRGRGYSGD